MTDNGIPLSDEQAERWATIRKVMLEEHTDAFWAVHSDGFGAGWSAAMQTIRQKIMDRIDVFQETLYKMHKSQQFASLFVDLPDFQQLPKNIPDRKF